MRILRTGGTSTSYAFAKMQQGRTTRDGHRSQKGAESGLNRYSSIIAYD